jgi:ATP-dependent Zn protease
MNEIIVGLGGRVAEELVLGEISTGAGNDLERVSKTARKMVTEYGMSDLGPMTFGRSQEEQVFLGRDISRDRNYSEEVAAKIDEEVHKIVTAAHDTARRILSENIDSLHKLAQTLKEQETVEAEELEALLAGPAGESCDQAKAAQSAARSAGSEAQTPSAGDAKGALAAIEERLKSGGKREPSPEGAPA